MAVKASLAQRARRWARRATRTETRRRTHTHARTRRRSRAGRPSRAAARRRRHRRRRRRRRGRSGCRRGRRCSRPYSTSSPTKMARRTPVPCAARGRAARVVVDDIAAVLGVRGGRRRVVVRDGLALKCGVAHARWRRRARGAPRRAPIGCLPSGCRRPTARRRRRPETVGSSRRTPLRPRRSVSGSTSSRRASSYTKASRIAQRLRVGAARADDGGERLARVGDVGGVKERELEPEHAPAQLGVLAHADEVRGVQRVE